MKSRIKKLVVVALASTMLLGATLTVNANHSSNNCQWHYISATANCAACGHTCNVKQCSYDSTQIHYMCEHGHKK